MKINPSIVVHKEVDGTSILYNSDTCQIMCLNTTGTVVWECIKENGINYSAMCDSIQSQFETVVPPEQLMDDLKRIVQQMYENNLLIE